MFLNVFVPLILSACAGQAPQPFRIQVVDLETGRGVPLVELKTVHDVRFYTDSNGIVAFAELGLMNQDVFFSVSSHGYEYPKDGFGFRGKRLKVTPGGSATLKIRRVNVAERLYRITGGGIYRDTVLTGGKPPIEQPVLNAQVLGSDSVVNAVFRNRMYWFWGDTNRPQYPLGNFHVPGATSPLPSQGLDPDKGIPLTYFKGKDGFAKPTAKMPGKGPTWISALTVLKAEKGKELLFAQYVKIAKPMKVYERGIVAFDPGKNEFQLRKKLDLKAPLFPHGHPFLHRDDGVSYVYFANPYPHVRVRATVKDFLDPTKYEGFTCLKAGSGEKLTVDRDPKGRARYGWKRGAKPITEKLQAKLIRDGSLKKSEAFIRLRAMESGKAVRAHSGSVYWNPYRKRWGMITVEVFGSSLLGEVWYAEADRPEGPYHYACKVVTHNRYDFYNPKQHPTLNKKDGRIIYFEGTYTNTFSGNPDRTPRYNYNQILYRLDLDHPRLTRVVPVHRYVDDEQHLRYALKVNLPKSAGNAPIAFYALDRAQPGTLAVKVQSTPDGDHFTAAKGSRDKAAFHVLSPERKVRPAAVTDLKAFGIRGYGWSADDTDYVTSPD